MPRGKGIEFERKIARQMRLEGWLVTRSSASLGAFDLIAINPESKVIKLIQCKKGWSFTDGQLQREKSKIKPFEGVYNVISEVIHEE